jgi:hyperosmotically inducible protein
MIVLPCSARTKQEAEKAEGAALDVEERAREAAERSDKAGDNAVKMLDRVIIKQRAKPADAKSSANDSRVTAKTKLAMVADERVKGRQITVETKNGVVTLRGTVVTEEARAAAEDIANAVSGIKSVKNGLRVAPSDSETANERDEAITEKVTVTLKKDRKLKKANISVRTDAGIVTLAGIVQDLLTSAHAAWTAWHVKGVRAVNNELTLKNK